MMKKSNFMQYGRRLALSGLLAAGLLGTGSAQAEVVALSGLQGWVQDNGGSDEAAFLTNNFTGTEFGHRFNSWAEFSIPAGHYTSVTLTVTPGSYGDPGPNKIAMYDVSTPIMSFLNTTHPGADVYQDLGSGREYAAAVFDNAPLTITLNGRALADINAAAGGVFIIGFTNETLNAQPVQWDGKGVYISGVGRRATQMQLTLGEATPVPEPSSWAMLLAGLALLSAAARGRRNAPRLKAMLAMAASAGLLAALPVAQAAPVNHTYDFEGASEMLLNDGDQFEMDGMVFTSAFIGDPSEGGGFTGALVNGGDPGLCTVMICPAGNASTYYAGLNDGALFMNPSKKGDVIHLAGFDASFILPDDGLHPAVSGVLQIQGVRADGSYVDEYYDLYHPAMGFAHYSTTAAFASNDFVQLAFFAYTCDAVGQCTAFNSDQAQFGLDNISAVPEPSAYLMLVLGFGLLQVLRRRAD